MILHCSPCSAPSRTELHRTPAKLDDLEACANEAMRLEPVGPLNSLQAAEEVVVVGCSRDGSAAAFQQAEVVLRRRAVQHPTGICRSR